MHSRGLASRGRAEIKYPSLGSIVSILASDAKCTALDRTWSNHGLRHIDKLFAGGNDITAWRTALPEQAKQVSQRIRDASNNAIATRKMSQAINDSALGGYRDAQFHLTREYVRLASSVHLYRHSASITWLLRARTGMHLTPPRLTYVLDKSRQPEVHRTHCPCCAAPWRENPHPAVPAAADLGGAHASSLVCVAHMLTTCKARSPHVRILFSAVLLALEAGGDGPLPPLSHYESTLLFLGGSLRPGRLSPDQTTRARSNWLRHSVPIPAAPPLVTDITRTAPLFVLAALAVAAAVPTAAHTAAHHPIPMGEDGTVDGSGRARGSESESEEEGDEGNTEDEGSDKATWDGSSEERHWSGADSTGTD